MTPTLDIVRCLDCGRRQLPPRVNCRFCGGTDFDHDRVAAEGTVYAFTVIRVPPARFEKEAPYTILAVRLGEDLTLTGRLADEADAPRIRIGERVRLVRQDEAGYRFAPVGAGQ